MVKKACPSCWGRGYHLDQPGLEDIGQVILGFFGFADTRSKTWRQCPDCKGTGTVRERWRYVPRARRN